MRQAVFHLVLLLVNACCFSPLTGAQTGGTGAITPAVTNSPGRYGPDMFILCFEQSCILKVKF